MRRKSDILIKYFQLPNTMFLSDEEFGCLVRRVMIEDDVDDLRYENLDAETADELRRVEQRWEETYRALRNENPMMISAKASLSVQVSKSTKAFEALRQRLNNKNLDDSVDDPEIPPPTVCAVSSKGTLSGFDVEIAGEVFSVLPNGTEKPANFPNKEDILNYLNSFESDECKISIVTYIAQFGNKDKWDKHWRLLAKEAEEMLE